MLVGEAHRMATVKARKRACTDYCVHAPGFQYFGCLRKRRKLTAKRVVCIPKPTLRVGPCHDKDVRGQWSTTQNPSAGLGGERTQRWEKMGRHGDRDCPVTEPSTRFLIRLPCRLVATPSIPLWMVGGIRQRYKRSFSRQPWLTSFPSRGTSIKRKPRHPNRTGFWRRMG
jgi:hypothetical protein